MSVISGLLSFEKVSNYLNANFPDIGAADFVATTIALNLALEFWAPLHKYLTSIVFLVHKKIDGFESQHQLNRLDEDAANTVCKESSECFVHLKEKAKGFCKINEGLFKVLAIAAACTALILLYLGITSIWNLLFLTPLALTIILAAYGYAHYFYRAWRIDVRVNSDISKHATGKEAITAKYSLKDFR